MNKQRKDTGKQIAILLLVIAGMLVLLNVNQCSQTMSLDAIRIEMEKMRTLTSEPL